MKLYLGNLSKQMTEAQLGELVKPFGTASSVSLATDKGTGQSRGFGFVEFGTDAEANAAIKALDGKEINGQTIKVNESRPKGGR